MKLANVVVFAVLALAAVSPPALAQQRIGPASTPSARVASAARDRAALEMVFVLDTTGSMGGLIEGAKERIWGIVNDVMKAPMRPRVRIGLVAYRDNGDAYVTRVTPLTSDLDKVYATLMDCRAEGGGDTPENVRRALRDGVDKAGWSQRSPQTAQIVFLVGDAPPHDDYANEPDCLATTGAAVRRGIVVNTIQCGQLPGTRETWQAIARRGEGQYFAIAQNGGVQTIATPYDKDLAALGGRLGTTYLAYGGGGTGGGAAGAARFQEKAAARQSALESRVAASAPAGAAADRAVNKAINGLAYSGDLLQSIENGSVTLEKVKEADLPADLRKMPPAQRKAVVAKRLAERKTMRANILALSRKRDAYLADARKKQTAKSGKGTPSGAFDTAVAAALRKQVAKKGIRL